MSNYIQRPGILQGGYPQKKEPQLTEFEASFSRLLNRFTKPFKRKIHSQRYVVRQVKKYHQQKQLQNCSEDEFDEFITSIRNRLHHQGLQKKLIFESFAIIREAAKRELSKTHYDVQLFGGWLMINGALAEMETGEGKTLATTLPACTAALAGIPVHVLTANNYLAQRDCEIMQPLYQRLGLPASFVIDTMTTEERQQCYQNNIVHTTNKQIAFDYLRDRIEIADDFGPLKLQFKKILNNQTERKAPLLLRGLCFALADEVDSLLVDEAKTPLIITRQIPNKENTDSYYDALYLASIIFEGQDFIIDRKNRQIELTLDGEENLNQLIHNLPKQWKNKQNREFLVTQALMATLFFIKDIDYIVKNGKINIIDKSTGRIMPDRTWEQGLHQMVEAKEGCIISESREPQARISYQRFFSRYLLLGGTSGTLKEVSTELQSVYGLDVHKVKTFRPNKRKILGQHIYRNAAIKKQIVIHRIEELYKQKRPVLIGTCSVKESEQVSDWLQQSGTPHQVLNAQQDMHEAEIIANAGQPGAITIATNMAGRGTDILLGPGVPEMGGLHVLSLCLNESKRIDRQLYGRCARQGDFGSAEAILSLEDDFLVRFYHPHILILLAKITPKKRPLFKLFGRIISYFAQYQSERKQRLVRKHLMSQDKKLRRILAFSGKFE